MSQQTCKTCSHWHGYLNENQNPPQGYGQCVYLIRDVQIYRTEQEAVPRYSLLPRPRLPLDGAGIVASDEDKTMIVTGPDFGCVKWEAKP